VDAAPNNPQLSSQLSWSVMTEVRSTEQLTAATKANVRSLAWSPAGMTVQAGCLLAVVNTDNMVRCLHGGELLCILLTIMSNPSMPPRMC
jgi:hypothetical protein